MNTWPAEPPSKRWVFFKRFDILGTDGLYLRRWRLIETPLFGIFLHKIAKPDKDADLHDHPWNFVSLVLRRSYIEWTEKESREVRWINVKRAEERHRIVAAPFGFPVWTLVLRGPRRRCWGFHTPKGWIPWHVYLGVTEKDEGVSKPRPIASARGGAEEETP